MTARQESDFAEVLVDRLFLESFANEHSPYHTSDATDTSLSEALDRFRQKLKWHIGHSLSRRQKEVIKHYLNGCKEREIAELLGVTQQVVNIYKRRAIKKLQKVMAT